MLKNFFQKYKGEIKVGLIVMIGLILFSVIKDLIKRS
jgi:hypothetical protein